jgi:hypothetical protein
MRRLRRYAKRRTTYLGLAVMRVLWPLWSRLTCAQRTWPAHVRLSVKARHGARGFDMAWLNVLVSILVLPVFLVFVPGVYEILTGGLPGLPQITPALSNALAVTGTIAALLLGAGWSVYFGHLLARRLQCGLLEWCAIVVLLGNLEGLVLTTPGVMSVPVFAVLLGLIVSALVFYGAALGLAEIRLLGVAHPLARVGVLGAAWWRLISIPLILGGCFLAFEEYLPSRGNLVGPRLALWGLPLVLAGVTGLLASLFIRYRTRRVCLMLLNER